ncbi:MAG: hypothetical protein KJ941_12490, partial [Bacteroidetes bacterium]|nr:hypothetical protein [Bacteroidota bacterium]
MKRISQLFLLFSFFFCSNQTGAQRLTLRDVQSIVDSTNLWINNGDYERTFNLLIKNEPRLNQLPAHLKPCVLYNINLAKTFTIRTNYSLALTVLQGLESTLPKIQDKELRALVLITFADFYRSMEKFKKCDLYFSKAKAHIDFTNNNFNKAYYYNRLAATYSQKGKVDESIRYSHLCIEVAKTKSYHKLLGLSYNELGYIYYNLGNVDLSRRNYLKGMQYSLSSGNLFDWGNTAMNLSILCYKNKRYALADQLLDSLIDISKKHDWKEILVRTYRCKSWKAEELQDSLNYWKYSSMYMNLITEYSEVNTNYAFYEKQRLEDEEKHLAELESKNESLLIQKAEQAKIRQRYALAISLFLIVLFFSLGMIYFMLKQKKASRELQEERKKLENSLQQNKILLNEIHHRVKNNMQVISSLLDLQRDYTTDLKAKKLLLEGKNRIKSIALVHEMMHQTDDISEINVKVYFEKIVEEIKKSLWHQKDVLIQLHCDPLNLKLNDAIPIGILLNELLTNSFKHAVTKQKSLDIRVQIVHLPNGIKLTYTDSGENKINKNVSEGMG